MIKFRDRLIPIIFLFFVIWSIGQIILIILTKNYRRDWGIWHFFMYFIMIWIVILNY